MMPRYDIRCLTCGKEEEISKGMNQDLPPCEVCGGKVEQILSPSSSFVLKGSGWAATGYSK